MAGCLDKIPEVCGNGVHCEEDTWTVRIVPCLEKGPMEGPLEEPKGMWSRCR